MKQTAPYLESKTAKSTFMPYRKGHGHLQDPQEPHIHG